MSMTANNPRRRSRSRSPRRSDSRRQDHSRPLPVEPLEPRRLLAATLDVNGLLTVTATAGADVLTLSVGGATLSVTLNSAAQQFASVNVSAITLDLLGGGDFVTLGAGVIGATVNLGDGNDTVTSGPGDDTLDGGAGNDSYRYNGVWGVDLVIEAGGGGNDTLDFSSLTAGILAAVGPLSVSSGNSTVQHGGNGIENIVGGAGDDTFFFLNGSSIPGTLTGGAGNNLLAYSLYTTPVNVNLAAGTATGAAGVSGIQFVIGGSGADNLTGDNNANTLAGGDGNDTLTGSGGKDTYLFSTGWGKDQVVETPGGGTDTLNLSDVTANLTFTVATGAVTDGTNTVSAPNVENLTGGSGRDRFVFQAGAATAGALAGGGGIDTLDYSALAAGVIVNLAGGSATGAASVSSFEIINGTPAADSLSGDTFANTIEGGAGNDSLAGNGGDDLFPFKPGWGNDTLTENAGGGTDTADLSAITSNLTVTISASLTDGANSLAIVGGGLENIISGIGDDRFIFPAGASTAGTLSAGAGNDTLDYSQFTQAVTVNLTANTATATGGISSFQAILGGSGNDNLTGEGGANTLSGSAGNDTLSGGGGDDLYLFANAFGNDSITESAGGGNDTADFSTVSTPLLFSIGPNTISDTTASATLSSAIENISSGSADDRFIFQDNAQIAGTISGGAGIDTLDYSPHTSAVAANLATALATGSAGATGFERLIGGPGNDNLTGNAESNTLTGNGGDDALAGAGGADTYLFADAWGNDTLTESPSADTDTADLSAVTSSLSITIATGQITDGVNSLAQSNGVENILAGAGNDVVLFADGASLGGTLFGGGGVNRLDYSSRTDDLTVNLLAATATGALGAQDFQFILGGAGNDNLVGGDSADTLNGGAGNDTLSGGAGDDLYVFGDGWGNDSVVESASNGADRIDFTAAAAALTVNIGPNTITDGTSSLAFPADGIDTIASGSADDTFLVADGATYAGALSAGPGINTISFAAATTAVAINLNVSPVTGGFAGAAPGIGRLELFDNAIGGAGDDTLTGNANANHLTGGIGNDKLLGLDGDDLLAGLAGNDTLFGGVGNDTLQGGADNDSLKGAAGNDRLSGSKGDDTLNGQAGDDTLIAGAGNDKLIGGAGSDLMQGNAGNDNFLAKDRTRDTLSGSTGKDIAASDADLDILKGIP
jgi:Ca2+-binding RTX toxin-like protein